MTPEAIVEREDIAPEDVINYVRYRLACRLRSRFAHIYTHDAAGAPDIYLRCWLKMSQAQTLTSHMNSETLTSHIANLFTNIYCSQDYLNSTTLALAEPSSPQGHRSITMHPKLCDHHHQLMHTAEHEITHIEQYMLHTPEFISRNATQKLYRDPKLEAQSSYLTKELEADYVAATFHPLARYAMRAPLDKGICASYPSPSTYIDRLDYVQQHLSPMEQYQQDLLIGARINAKN